MSTKKVSLNLGCGRTRIPGTIGVDRVKVEDFVDVVWDLDQTPYPFKDNSVDEVHMYHVLEHLHNPLEKLEELHRLLKPKGVVYLRVPHFSSMGAFTDITHIRPFGYLSFEMAKPDEYHHFYTKRSFDIVSKRIKFLGQYPNSGVYEKYVHRNNCPLLFRPVVHVIDFLINLSPILFERFWCYWVGGATEVMITLRKV